MSREKMLQAEIALKDEQLADLTTEVERLRRQAEEAGKRRQTTDANESKIAELKQTIGKLAPLAKKIAAYAADLNETRRRLIIVEKERSELSENYVAMQTQTTWLKNALDKAQKDIRALDNKRKEAAERAKVAETNVKTEARQKLMAVVAAALICAGTIGGGYAYVRAALNPPAELSEEASAAFKQSAAEYRLIVERAAQNERDKLDAERTRLAAERDRYQELNENTVWDNIVSYGWRALIFGGGFMVGAVTIFAAFVFWMR